MFNQHIIIKAGLSWRLHLVARHAICPEGTCRFSIGRPQHLTHQRQLWWTIVVSHCEPPSMFQRILAKAFLSVSPSIYVVFQSLVATDLCGVVGSTYYNKTLSFAPSELSTSRGLVFLNSYDPWIYPPTSYAWSAFNYDELSK